MIAANAPAVSAMSAGSNGSAEFVLKPFGEKGLRLFFARLVGEPVLVMRHRALTQCRNDAVERHFVRIAEGEIADAGFAAPLAVTRRQIEILYSCKGRIGCLYPGRYDRH